MSGSPGYAPMPDPSDPSVFFPVVTWGAFAVTFQPSLPPPGVRPAAVVVFALHDGKFLLADILDRGWCVPSGRLEHGEAPSEAAARETREEIGGELEEVTLIGHYTLKD